MAQGIKELKHGRLLVTRTTVVENDRLEIDECSASSGVDVKKYFLRPSIGIVPVLIRYVYCALSTPACIASALAIVGTILG
jgi:hypothetical protein